MKAFKRNKKSKFIFGAILVASVFILSSLMISCKNKDDDDDVVTPSLVITPLSDKSVTKLLEELKTNATAQNADSDAQAVLTGDSEHETTGFEFTGSTYDFDALEQGFNEKYDALKQEAIDSGAITQADATSQNASASYMIRTWTYEYWTNAANGERIKASGTVSLGYAKFPIYGEWWPKLNYVVLHPHYTKTADREMPSKDKSTVSDTAIMQQLAANDAMIISPDYEGYGSTSNRKHPYLMHEALSKQCVDMLESVMKWYKNNGYQNLKFRGFENNWDLYTFGYSQGGSQALAIQKYIETNPSVSQELKDHLRGSVCGGGPYDPVATYKWYLKQKEVSYPVIFPLVLDGYISNYQNTYLKGYKLEDFLTKPMLETVVSCDDGGRYTPIEALRSKKYDAHQIGAIIAKAYGHTREREVKVSEVLTAAALDENSAASKAVLAALEANNLLKDWTPRTNIIFYHSNLDDVVPIVNYTNALNFFRDTGKIKREGKYIYHTTKSGIEMGKHSTEGAWFYGNFVFKNRDFKYLR